MLLAADIGGTTSRLGLFDRAAARPRPIVVRSFPTRDHRSLAALLSAFAADVSLVGQSIESACFGVAGPVAEGRAELTNVFPAWTIAGDSIGDAFTIGRMSVVNDLQALAFAVPALGPGEVAVLQEGNQRRGGNIAIIAAGTGLGEAVLHAVDGKQVATASEAGHADFAARNEREIDVLRDLILRFGHAPVEQVLSGRGLVNIHRVTHAGSCSSLDNAPAERWPAAIAAAALARSCRGCVEALGMFVDAYGAEAGNLALRSMTTGGVFVGGGIAPKILPALADGRFIRAFVDKEPAFSQWLATIPVKVILNDDAGLVGAAIHASAI
jgi:glucokinase